MKKLFTTLCCVMALATIKLNAQCGTTFGNFPPSYTIAASFGANYLLGDSYTLTTGGTLTGLGYKGNGTAATMRMAIYADAAGLPSNLVAYTNTVLVGTGNFTIPITTPTAIPAGVYWIMADYVNGTGTNHVNYTSSTSKTVCYISYSPISIPPNTAAWTTYTGQDFDYWGVIAGAAAPTLSITGNINICNGQNAILTASGANTYTWSTSAQTTTISITPTVTTNYTVVGTSTAGCMGSSIATIVVNATPTISVNSGTICAGSSFTMVPNGASSYTFQGGGAVKNPTATTSYTVVGTNTTGCISNIATSNVTVNATPTISVNSGAICAGSSFTMVPSGASSYTFSSGSAVTTPSINSSYTVTGTSTVGCVSNAVVSNVTVNAVPTISVNSGAICAGSSFTMLPSGASSYTFQGGSAVKNPTATTSYTVVGTNTAGCISNIATANVTVNALPTITASSSNSGSVCAGQSVSLTASGAATYSWNTGATTTVIAVSPSVTTNYTVNGVGTNGCTNIATITQLVNSCVGIQTNNNQHLAISIYPNPSNGEFTLELANGLSKVINVTDIIGRVVLTTTSVLDNVNINISTLVNGIYFIKVISNNKAEIIKVVKQ